MKNISVILLTKNAGNSFSNLLIKLRDQTHAPFEIIVIDSGSLDDTIKIAELYGCQIHKILPEDFHHSKTRNYGADLASGDYLVYLTQDAMPIQNDFIENLIQPLENNKVAAVYGKQVAYPNANPIEKFFYQYFYPEKREILRLKDLDNYSQFCITHVYISDVCAAINKEIYDKIPFDDEIVMAEDKKWAIDVINNGFEIIYEPKASIFHSHNYTLKTGFIRRFEDGFALKQICKSVDFSRNGFSYFVAEMSYLYRNFTTWIPYALFYNLIKLSAFTLGINYKSIPKVIRKKISNII